MPFLKKLYAYWMRFAMALGWVNTRIILFVFFVLVLGPIGLVGRLFGKNFFEEPKRGSASYWHVRPEPRYSPEHFRRQF
jgi:hypothetical protein